MENPREMQIATRQGERSAADIVDEMFLLARGQRDKAHGDDGYAMVRGQYRGEQIEIRVRVEWRAQTK